MWERVNAGEETEITPWSNLNDKGRRETGLEGAGFVMRKEILLLLSGWVRIFFNYLIRWTWTCLEIVRKETSCLEWRCTFIRWRVSDAVTSQRKRRERRQADRGGMFFEIRKDEFCSELGGNSVGVLAENTKLLIEQWKIGGVILYFPNLLYGCLQGQEMLIYKVRAMI